MSSMEFLTAQKELAAQLGLDYTQTDTAILIKRWLNLSYKDIVGFWNWQWLDSVDVITTKVDNTATGDSLTVSVSSGSSTLTFSSTIATSQTGRYIQLKGANDWYKITAHTAGTATMTISPAYAQSTNLSAGTYTIRTRYYSLASTTDKVYSATQASSKIKLQIISAYSYETDVPFSDASGKPYALYMWKQDSSGYWEVTFYPSPDSAILVEFRVKKKSTELSGDTDTPIFPDRFDSVWLDLAMARGHEHNDDDRANTSYIRGRSNLELLKKQDMADIGKILQLRSIDETRKPRNLVPFPSNFGEQP